MAQHSKRKQKKVQSMPVLQPNAAGVDIGAKEIFVAVDGDRDRNPVRHFSTFTPDIHKAAQWLKEVGIESVAMESTGVYWIPVFEILESYGFQVLLVNARHVKNVPGRKTDVQDCQWLQYLHAVGLLRGSYRPPKEICAVRTLRRHRENLVKTAVSHVQRMQKALTQMNIQIHHVISDITGVTGLAIIDAILAGERDPRKLADLKDPRIHAEKKIIAKALIGHYLPEHLFTLKQALECYRHYQKMIVDCDHEIEKCLQKIENHGKSPQEPYTRPAPKARKKRSHDPNFDLGSYMARILNTDLTQVEGIGATTAHTFFTEVGTRIELLKFPTEKHFSSWLGLCPANKISGGKILSSRTRKVENKLATALRMSAQSLWHSQSYLGDYRKMKARHGTPKATTAAAHKLARIIYAMVKYQIPYDKSIIEEREKFNKERKLQYLHKQAQSLGFQLVPAWSYLKDTNYLITTHVTPNASISTDRLTL